MDAYEYASAVEADPRFAQLSLEEKISMREDLFRGIAGDADFRLMDTESQNTFRKKYLTSPMAGLDLASLITGDEEDQRSGQFLGQANSAWETGIADIGFGEGFGETVTNYVSGKVGTFAVDLFTEEDTTKRIFGNRSDDYKAYRDYVMDTLDPEGANDWRAGKLFGNLTGFAGDALASTTLYGSVGSAGLLTKGIGGIGTKLAAKTAGKGALETASRYAGAYLAQFGVEGLGYVAEEAVADAITGELSRNTSFNEYLATVPGDFAKGVVMSGVGELLGFAAGGALSGAGRVLKPGGFQTITSRGARNVSLEDNTNAIVEALRGNDQGRLATLLKSGGADGKQLATHINSMKDTVMALDPTNAKNDPEGFQKALMKALYGVDTVKVGDSLQVTTFAGKPLAKPVTVTTTQDMHALLKEQRRQFDNSLYEFSAKLHSDKEAGLQLDVVTKNKTETLNLDSVEISDIFRPANTEVDAESLRKIADSMLAREDVKIVPIDAYFNNRFKPKRSTGLEVYIPKTINTADEAALFGKEFFQQMKRLGDGVEVNTKHLQAMLKNTSSVKYDREFVNLFMKPNQIKTDSNKVSLKIGDEWQDFKNFQEAGRALHMSHYDFKELSDSLNNDLGLVLFKEQDGSYSLHNRETGEKTGNYAEVKEMFNSPATRPPLPWSQRPSFRAFSATGEAEVTQLEGKTIKQLSKSAREYSKNPGYTPERFSSDLGGINGDPKFKVYKVTMKDSGLVKEFQSVDAARKWMTKDFNTFKDLEQEAWDRGIRLQPHVGGFSVESDVLPRQVFKDLENAKKYIGRQDEIANVKDVFDSIPVEEMDAIATNFAEESGPAIEKAYGKALAHESDYKGFAENRIIRNIDRFWMPIRERFAKIGDSDAIVLSERVKAADKAFNKEYGAFLKRWKGIMHGTDPQDSRVMYEILKEEANGRTWQQTADDMGYNLTDKMVSQMEATRTILDVAGSRFGVSSQDWINSYFPRLRKLTDADLNALTTSDSFKKSMENPAPQRVDPFFKHMRTEDYVQGRYQEDLEGVIDSYMRLGYRELYLNDVIDDSRKFIKTDGGNQEAKELLYRMTEQASGRVYSSEQAAKTAERVRVNMARADARIKGEGVWAEKTLDERRAGALRAMGTNSGEMASDAVTSSLMAFKLKMPMRNISQTFSIGSTMVGTNYVKDGWKYIGDVDRATDLYLELLDYGIIRPRGDIVRARPILHQKLKQANDFGMDSFYNSDDHTRMVMSVAARERFRDGLVAIKEGDLAVDNFLDFTKMSWLNPTDQAQFMKHMQSGDTKAAEVMMMRKTTEMTMFEYDLVDRPEGLTSGLGKVFGKFGTYSSQYVQFLKRGYKVEKAAFIARLCATTYATSMVYSDLLGIDNVSATPYDVAAFTGAPMFTSGISILDDVKNGRATPKSVWRDANILVPFFGQLNSMKKGVDAISEGQMDDGLVRFLGATPTDERKIDKLAKQFNL